MSLEDDESLCIPEYGVIQEIYDAEDAEEFFEDQLENYLDAEVPYIIIEPERLGDETAKWIQVGNCLHKTAVLSGLASVIAPVFLSGKSANYVSIPLGGLSLICASLYGVSWQFDPCCKYQVEYDPKNLEKLHFDSVASAAPIVLVRKDDKYRKRLHNCIAFIVTAYFGWKIYTTCR